MIKIGEFSSLTGISIHMLRNYDKIGLLVPAHTDVESGYRYYKEEQIPVANQIVVLKNLGFGLKEIADIQLQYNSTERMQEFLSDKMKEKQAEIQKAQEQMNRMQQAMQELAKEEMRSLSVTVKTIPERTVASLRGLIYRFEDEGLLWEELGQICEQLSIKNANYEYSYAITHHLEFDFASKMSLEKPDSKAASNDKSMAENYRIKEIDVEVQRVIEKLPSAKVKTKAGTLCSGGRVIDFFCVPQCEAAALAFRGKYSQLGDINAYMAEWVKKNGYRISGMSFVTYYLSPGNEPNPDNFVTEVCFPVVKQK